MAWIKSHSILSRNRKLNELALSLRIKPVYAMGHLHALWHDALEQQEDGDLSMWSDALIAKSSQYDGDAPRYVSLLQQTGWLDNRLIHSWLDYAGRYLESKYHTSNPEKLRGIWAKYGLVRLKSDCSPPLVTLDKTRLDKIRKNKTPTSFSFETVWENYPRRDGRKAAQRHFEASVKTEKDWLDIQKALKNYTKQIERDRVEPKFIKMASTWFNNWRDWVDHSIDVSASPEAPAWMSQ